MLNQYSFFNPQKNLDPSWFGLPLMINNKNTNGEIVNIGSNFEISILEIINKIKKILDSDAKIIEEKSRLRPKNSEVYRLWCDNSKIKNLTGFEPKVDIDLGLRKTIDWIKVPDNLLKYKTNIYNVWRLCKFC